MGDLETGRAGPAGRLVGGRYRLDRPLGSGAMGTVWRGHDTRLGRDVAVKEVVLPPSLPEGERCVLRERTLREARVTARLHHPSAVAVYDVVETDGRPCLVMELVEAGTLADVVRDTGPLRPAETARVGLALLGALEAAHDAGVLHRDVKPGNVLLTRDGRVVLTDFGIATSVDDVRVTSTGLLLGSPAYMAPERARGRTPGPPSDLWSLGATLYACVEGRPPFEGDDPLATLTAVVSAPAPPPACAGPLAPLLLGLLEKDPERRLDARAARSLLVAALGGHGAGASPAEGRRAHAAAGEARRDRGARVEPPRTAEDGDAGLTRPAIDGRRRDRRDREATPDRRREGRRREGRRRAGALLRGLLVALALLTSALGGFALQRELPALQGPATASVGSPSVQGQAEPPG